MAIDTLGKLFGSSARVKIMRLFILNPEEGFENKDVARRTKVQAPTVRKELNILESTGLVKKKTFYKEVPVSSRSKTKSDKTRKKKVRGYFLEPHFEYLKPLQSLLIETEVYTDRELAKRIKPTGKIEVLVASGIFIRDEDSRVDLLVVGKKINRRALQEAIRSLEAEIGRELQFAVFDTPEFEYRLSMYDKLVCDILDYPHECLIDLSGIVKNYKS